ncbi:MAG: DUF4131 domain-containing protein, partial [Alphaproteobacteria bacterium]|nr:DUF4131 domain-containing protein [Alphaproteobacteria bacterium]
MQADEGEDGGGPHPVWVRPAPRHGGTVVGRLLAGPLAPALAALRRGLAAQEGRLTLFAPLLLGWGIAHYFSLRTEPGLATTLFWALAAGAAGAGLLRWRPAGPALWLAAALVLPPTGMLLAKLRTEAVSAPRLARETGTVELSGRILGLARESPGSVKLLLAPRAIEGLAPEALPARIRLTVRGTPERLEALTSGAEITGLARLMPPSPPVAPGAYDFARAAWFDRIGGLGFTLGVPRVVEPAVPDRTGPALWLAGLREGIARRIAAALPEAPATPG